MKIEKKSAWKKERKKRRKVLLRDAFHERKRSNQSMVHVGDLGMKIKDGDTTMASGEKEAKKLGKLKNQRTVRQRADRELKRKIERKTEKTKRKGE